PRYINTTVHVQFETKRRNVYFANNFNWNNTLFKFSITFSDVKYISIFKLEVTEGMLQLCEIELIGDCVSGFFGYLCDGICSLTCANQMCDNYGRCIQCVQGRKGPYCQDVEIIEVIVNTTLTTPLAGQAEGDKFHHSEEIFLLIVFITIPIVACFLCYGLLTVYTERTSSLYNVEF
ncbi:laminin subunit alpha isoform X3, partial [Biomphalaria glabrata]